MEKDMETDTERTEIMVKQPYAGRLTALRARMRENGIDAYIIVTDDFHGSEYVGDYFKCREFISGFDGSAGTLVVTEQEAGLWTDGRYFLQARDQLAGTGIELRKMGDPGVPTITEYLKTAVPENGCVGYDGRTISAGFADSIARALESKTVRFRQDADLAGELWENRPEFPHAPIWLLNDRYTGMSRAEKLRSLREKLQQAGADSAIIASLDDIAWLYNFRGSDVEYNPVAMSYTLVSQTDAVLYISPEAVSKEIAQEFAADGISLKPYLQIYEDAKHLKGGVLLDGRSINVALRSALGKTAYCIPMPNPTTLQKAVKTPTECENMRLAHIRDGVAMTKLICWLKHLPDVSAVTEMDVSRKLEQLRRQQPDYLQPSFPSIVAAGAHGAIIHYEPTDKTDVPLEKDSFVLMDTGAHFLQGTTDITRTVALGRITEKQKIHYTAVLRGNLGILDACLKYGCTGVHLDAIARMPLWELGLDYNHGTGHGVGYLLNVHEGPNHIGLKDRNGGMGTVFEPGMITSDEPGLYLEGEYGIRLENLVLTVDRETTEYGRFLGFEALTMVPFDRDAILPECMTERERKTLNTYHARVYEIIAPYLTKEEAGWLRVQTLPL